MDWITAEKPQKLFILLLGFSFCFHLGVLFKNIQWQSLNFENISEEPKALIIKIKTQNDKSKQIVRTNKSEDNIANVSDYLGEKNNTFDRETTARNIDIYKRAGIGVRNGVDQAQEAVEKQRKKSKRKVSSLADLSLNEKMDLGEIDKERALQMSKKGLINGTRGELGLAANNDYLEEVPLGDFTKLNTQEFKYFGFYNRIRVRLENFWGASVKEKSEELFKSGRRFPASENYITSLIIKIDENGVIRDVKVKSSSGIRELDEAAIQSFNKAGPFPNPPKELVKNGTATIEWGFVVNS